MTALYWDFVARHAERLAGNRRTVRAVRMLERMDPAEREAVSGRARAALEELEQGAAVTSAGRSA